MPEFMPEYLSNQTQDDSYENSSLNLHHPENYPSLTCHIRYPVDLNYKGLKWSPRMIEPNLQDLTETEVFVGEEDFLLDDESHLEGGTQSSLIINYKDTFLHPLNSVKEEIEAEAAEEEMSGNFHSLDYLGQSVGVSSLSSSVMSSMSLDEVTNCSACIERHGAASCKYFEMHGSNYCPHHMQMYRDPAGVYSLCDNASVSIVKHVHMSNSNGKVSPASCWNSPNLGKNIPNLCKEESPSCRLACKSMPQKSGPSLEKAKVCSEKKMLVWHNPSKSDKLSNSTTVKEKDSSALKRYGSCRVKSDTAENLSNESKFSSLPRKKKEKNEKDISAETYGTLGQNRKKKETTDPFSHKFQNTDKHIQNLPHDSKNILDKYATLPRKRAKEINSKWREQTSQKESKEVRPPLQRSKSIGKGETSQITRATSSSSFSTSSAPNINSPRNAPSKPTMNGKLVNKIISPSMRLIAKQNYSATKEKGDKSPSPKIYSSTSQPKFIRIVKKNAAVQVDLHWELSSGDLDEKFKKLVEENNLLQSRLRNAEANAEEVEQMRMEAVDLRSTAENEKMEKEELQEELDRTSGKVKEMLASMEGVEKEFNNRGESLIELENHLQTSSEFNIKMQDKLNQYEDYTVKLRKDLDKSLAAQKILLQQVQDLEGESREMADFVAEEKNSLAECLKEAELELCRQRKEIEELRGKLVYKEDEARHMVRLAEERRRSYLSIQMELKSVQSRAEDMMVCQGAQVSEASIGLANLTSRLQIISGKLVQDYTISENDIENVVTPVDSDSSISSSATGTPELHKSPVRSTNRSSPPRKPVSFMQSFLNAMRIAHSSSKLISAVTEEPGSSKALEIRSSSDSSEKNGICCLETKEPNDEPSSQSLSDQVAEVDALLTRFLKVCCVLKSDADNILSELEDENERLCTQIQLQQQMIDQQYAEFESLSNLESNARKELKLITKDLEFANATLNKVCEDDSKQVKNVEEALRAINLNLARMDTMHAEKRNKITQARHTLPIAQDCIHSQTNFESSFGKHKISSLPHIRVPKCKRHWRENKGNDGQEDYLNSNSGDEKEGKDNEVNFIINQAMQTLEVVPDIISSSPTLKNLYQLSSSTSLEKDVNCNPNNLQFSNDLNSTTSNTNLMKKEIPNGSITKDRIPVNSSTIDLPAADPFISAPSVPVLSSPLASPCDNANDVSINNALSLESTLKSSLDGTRPIPVDCNANPEIETRVTADNQDPRTPSTTDPIRLIPLLTNETSL